MGISITHLTNHDLHFTHTDELIRQIQERTGMPVFVEYYKHDEPEKQIDAPPDFKGWSVRSEDQPSLQAYFEKGGMLTLYHKTEMGEWIQVYVNTHLLEFSTDDMYMGKWRNVESLVDWINDHGIPAPQDYEHLSVEVAWIFKARKKRFESMYNLGAKDPKMISFCDDIHPEWLDYFFEEQWGMEEFIQWGKEKLIHVKFSALAHFDFPEGERNYDVFIEDDFEDLKSSGYQWMAPMTEIVFEVDADNEIYLNTVELITSLCERAAQWKINISAAVHNGVIKGVAKYLKKDISKHLALYLLQSFFRERNLTVSIR